MVAIICQRLIQIGIHIQNSADIPPNWKYVRTYLDINKSLYEIIFVHIMLDFKNEVEKIDGWLTPDEGIFLYESAKKVKQKNAIVEIGSWKGRSTICLGKGAKDGNQATVYAIDPHVGSSLHQNMFGSVDTFQEFTQNIRNAKVDQHIEPIRDTSENAIKNFGNSIEFIFIDGTHKFKFVNLDLKLWFPKVVNGGIIVFHDSWHFPGPNLSTAIVLLISSKIKNPKMVDTMTYFEKVEKNSFVDRMKNICFLIFRTLFGIKGALKLEYSVRK